MPATFLYHSAFSNSGRLTAHTEVIAWHRHTEYKGWRGAPNLGPRHRVFWETGQVLPAARRQMVQDRLVPALAAIAAGGLIIVWWRSG